MPLNNKEIKSLEKAVNWFFNGGYKDIAKSKKDAPTQSLVSSAYTSVMRVSDTMKLTPSEVLLLTYEGRRNGK